MEDSCEISETVIKDRSSDGGDNSKTQDEKKNHSDCVDYGDIVGKANQNGKKSRIRCPQCDKTLIDRVGMKRHLRDVHSSTDVECELCFKRFKSRGNLRAHKKNIHTTQSKEMSEKCKLCNKICTNKRRLNRHIRITHPVSDGMVKCNICPNAYKTMELMMQHKNKVHPTADKTVQCAHCDKTFKAKYLLKSHIKWHHPTDSEIYECVEKAGRQICHKVFRSEIQLQKHISIVHALPEEAQKCELCQKTFKSSKHFQAHMYSVHAKSGLFVCEICRKKFQCRKYFVKHQSTHALKELPCLVCSKKFKRHDNLQGHMKRMHFNSDFKCTCEMILNSYSAYKEHKLNCASIGFKPCISPLEPASKIVTDVIGIDCPRKPYHKIDTNLTGIVPLRSLSVRLTRITEADIDLDFKMSPMN